MTASTGKRRQRSDYGQTKSIAYYRLEYATCNICGSKFEYPRRTRPRTRCEICAGESRARALSRAHTLGPERRRPLRHTVIRSCAYCGSYFHTRHRARIYCSDNCGHLIAKQTRRARITDSQASPIGRSAIGERDHWICGICAQPIDPHLRVPEHRAPTLDHIIPLSKGGQHTDDNVQIAHFICNTRKGVG